jgi:saccharopine dehydrogenase-like NADP-dependent oxidoreductase
LHSKPTGADSICLLLPPGSYRDKLYMGKNILLLGAGKSSSYLIKYLTDQASREDWQITVADADVRMAQKKTGRSRHAQAVWLDANNLNALTRQIGLSHLVISLLPPTMHVEVAKLCLLHKKHLITASYASPEMQALNYAAQKSGVLFLNECGLDPGIDHMSAMKMIDGIHSRKGSVVSFRSYCGGLIADSSDTNPWNYKFTWNPSNVVLAGKQTARFLQDGILQFIPPQRIFRQIEHLKISGADYDGYANRDSLSYIEKYNLHHIQTMLRGTLRKTGFCEAWDVLVRIGLTDDSFKISNASRMSYAKLLEALMPVNNKPLKKRLELFTTDKTVIKKIEWLGLLSDQKISGREFSPAEALQQLLEKQWKLEKGDHDLVIMQHIIGYKLKGKNYTMTSTLKLEGEDETYTAMAKTVGLPLGIAAKLILDKKINLKGVKIPTDKIIYEPLLQELKKFGIKFTDKSK